MITSMCQELISDHHKEPSSMNLIELAFRTNFNFKKSKNSYNLFVNLSKNEINIKFLNFFQKFFLTVDIL
jgi:hypothetical protein